MRKPILYIDVDDTILGLLHKDGWFLELRPGVLSQLRALSRLFDCRWLTSWDSDDIFPLIKRLYGARLNQDMKHTSWKHLGDKAAAVLADDHNFWWLEDPLPQGELDKLKEAGLIDRYIEVNPEGINGFTDGCLELFRRADITANDLKRVGCSMDWFTRWEKAA